MFTRHQLKVHKINWINLLNIDEHFLISSDNNNQNKKF
jgi:hypothetical protein